MSDEIIKYALTGYDAGVAPSRMGTLVSLSDHLTAVGAARAETERLTKAHDTVCGALAEAIKRAEKAEAERDEARAQVAAAYEAAAKECSLAATKYLGKGADTDLGSRSRAICDVSLSLRAMTPADAKAALEAYGREKVREGAADAWKAAALML